MKNLLLIVTALSFVFASCTSTKNSLALKRKYNKGYYIASNHKVKKQNTVAEKTISAKTQVEATEIQSEKDLLVKNLVPVSETFIETTKQDDKEIARSSYTNKAIVNHNTKNTVVNNEVASVIKSSLKNNYKEVVIEKKSKSAAKGSSGGNTILLVILCFFPFIVLIAMYLHDGKSITLNFWIDLLLHLTFIGYIIFGILVVLDIVNLA